MGEKAKEVLKLQFDKRLRLEFHGARITSDAGLLACRGLLQGSDRWIDNQVYTITDKSDEGQDASSRTEMGNPKLMT